MDPDWEDGLWSCHGMVNVCPIGNVEPKVLEVRNNSKVIRTSLGKIDLVRTDGSSIAHTLTYPLEPTRESWNLFKHFLDPSSPERYPINLKDIAASRNSKDIVTGFMGGSFYGWIRDFMGVENLSYLMYDDPVLLEDIVSHLTDMFIFLMKPVLDIASFDFVYFFEDCCGTNGPLFSPAFYRTTLHKYYCKLIDFYKTNKVPFALIDSDGVVDKLVPCWLDSGFDIIFPVEVGTWKATPTSFREKFGSKLRMFGGLNKYLIYGSEEDLRKHLLGLKRETEKGGYIPIPDHRIPPQVSYSQITRYIDIFHEIFG
jgi:uroporphyrinogen decarboxylase